MLTGTIGLTRQMYVFFSCYSLFSLENSNLNNLIHRTYLNTSLITVKQDFWRKECDK